MKPIEEIRRANLKTLVTEAGSAAKLSVLTGVPQPYISQVQRGVPHPKTGKPREMGQAIARKLEVKMGKQKGWMDVDHAAIGEASELTGREGQLLGLFRVLSATEQMELINTITAKLRAFRSPGEHDAESMRH